MAVESGTLRHRIEIQEYRYISQDPVTGAEIRQWQRFHECWASVEPLSVRELVAAQANQSKVTMRVKIRYVDGIDAGMRIVRKVRGVEQILNIEGVQPDPDSGLEWLTLPCSAGVSINGQ